MDLFEGLSPLDVGRVTRQRDEFFDHQCRFTFGCLNIRSALVEPKFKVPGDLKCPPMMSTQLTPVQTRDPLLPDKFLYWSKRQKKVRVCHIRRKLSRESPEDLEDSWSPERKKSKKRRVQ